jgi:GR25 family glycosyltransferase involved in LPS biosynthesis
MVDELDRVLDSSGAPLSCRTTRVSAVDAREHHDYPRQGLVESTYSLGDQLFVDPHPLAMPDRLDLDERIEMSPQEVAVACSHVDVWKRIASGPHGYAMVLEDDIWFHPSFGRVVDRAWSELRAAKNNEPLLDLLYVSYREVDYGAEKVWVSPTLFSPFRGLWYLSGYVLSKNGAEKLLRSLPISGPVDLWMNHQFGRLNVYGTVKSIVEQRLDEKSNNSYSVLPILSRIGVLNSETPGLFRGRPALRPVFAFGAPQSGLSSLAMALSMLGYRCCSDVDRLPQAEMQRLLRRDADRMFDAYVNVADLRNHVERLAGLYPDGRLILTADGSEVPGDFEARLVSATGDNLDEAHKISVAQPSAGIGAWRARALELPFRSPRIWKLLCEFLNCVPPVSPYPYREDLGQRLLQVSADDSAAEPVRPSRNLQFDDSPWVVAPGISSRGVPSVTSAAAARGQDTEPLVFVDDFRRPELALWQLRDDTFPGNLALFRPSNFVRSDRGPALMILRKEDVGVRMYTSAAISSRAKFLHGRFEAVLRPPRVPGTVTGLFLHRDSPRQEIDIELVGKRPRQMLTNVYYNPGGEGARFDFGYRGTPVLIDLGFDATEEFHSYAIEWSPNQLRWYVDGCLVHRRANWAPTPIPHLPMQFHLNLWPSRSRELAGRLRDRHLPAACAVMSVRLRSRSVVDSAGQVISTLVESAAGV